MSKWVNKSISQTKKIKKKKKSAHDNEEKTPLTANRESLPAATKTKHNQKIK